VFHSGDSRRDTGRGFPDLVLAGVNGVLFREVKDDYNPLRPAQVTWKHTLLAARADWDIWRPVDLSAGTIEHEIRRIA
jgi:hypothetical protein